MSQQGRGASRETTLSEEVPSPFFFKRLYSIDI
jgi:hypothetical protein